MATGAVPAMADSPSWGPPQLIDPGDGVVFKTISLAGVSCPSDSFCMAVDSGQFFPRLAPRFITYNGTSWSAPQPVSAGGLFGASPFDETTGLSCASANFCAAVNVAGQVVTYNGSGWSSPQTLDTKPLGLNSVSCVSASFCMAVAQDNAYFLYDGSSWSAHGFGADNAGGVSCVSASFCAATSLGDANPPAFTAAWLYDGSNWSPAGGSVDAARIDGPALRPPLVSCASSTFCAVVDTTFVDLVTDGVGNASLYHGTAWSPAQKIDGLGLGSVSCPSASFCVAVDAAANALIYNGSGWSAPQLIDPAVFNNANVVNSVSCASASFCVAVDAAGNAVAFETPPVNIALPTISGSPQQGETLTASTGSWSNRPASFAYQWDDCNSDGTGCTAVSGASSSSHLLTAGDVGHTVEVQVTAANGGGNGTPVFSAATGVVTAAAAGVTSGSAPTPVTAAQVRAALAGIRAPAGANATISKILKRGGYTVSFTAPSGGILTIDWYAQTTVKRHHKRLHKKILIAHARTIIRAAGKTTVKVKLTKQVSQLLKHSKRLKVTDKTTFTPTGGKPTTRTSTFTLRRR